MYKITAEKKAEVKWNLSDSNDYGNYEYIGYMDIDIPNKKIYLL